MLWTPFEITTPGSMWSSGKTKMKYSIVPIRLPRFASAATSTTLNRGIRAISWIDSVS